MNVQTISDATLADEASRAKRLRTATQELHGALDKRIMNADPFGNRRRYGDFLEVQHDFHSGVDQLYSATDLQALIPDLPSRRRLDLIRQDLVEVGDPLPPLILRDDYLIDVPNALGWIYVAEGSTLGAAFLLKEAAKLGFTESFGARHLAAHVDGRGLHWRTFTTALDAVSLNGEEEERVIEGAKQAFVRFRGLVEKAFP